MSDNRCCLEIAEEKEMAIKFEDIIVVDDMNISSCNKVLGTKPSASKFWKTSRNEKTEVIWDNSLGKF